MKTFALAFTVATLALGAAAQNTSTSSNIPSGISAGCQSFLATLNTDTELSACTQPLLSATKFYSSNSSDTTSQLDSTLADLCTPDANSSTTDAAGCDQNIIRTRLDQFWQNCHTDLQAKNAALQAIYDNLYMITPLVNSICSKDSSGSYCLKTIAKAAASSTRVTRRSLDEEEGETVAELIKRQSESLSGLENETNVTSTGNTNAAFLFISSSSPKSILCSECSQLILASYIKFETSIPYGIGLRTSEILAPQSDIYKAAKADCGAAFVKQVNVVANTTAFAEVGASAALRAGSFAVASLALAATGALLI